MDHLGLVFAELGLILVGVSVLGILARRFGLSPIPFYLIAGLAFGDGGIAPVSASGGFVTIGAEIGVLLLLLTLGLEFSATELSSSLARHGTSGIIDLLLNALPGLLLARLAGLSWPASLAMAGLTWISSSGIVSQLLRDLDRVANRETPAVLSVLVLEDLAMAVYLPILLVVLTGGGVGQAVVGILLAVAAVSLALLAATRASEGLGRLLSHDQDEQVMLRVLGLTLLVAAATHLLGASAAVGAFLVGIAIPGALAARARSILGPQRDLFAALFFVAFGLSVDPRQLLAHLPLALILAAAGIGGKVLTGWYAAGRDGVRRAGRLRAGFVLTPRGEFSIVIAGLAVSAGHPQVGLVGTAYVLVLAVVGPVLAKFGGTALPWRRSPGP